MLTLWSAFVGSLQMALVLLAQAYGGSLGLAIVTLSLLVRLALLPLSVYLARRAQARDALLRSFQPEIDRLRTRYANDPAGLARRTNELYREHGLSTVDLPGALGGFVQLPLMAGMYAAIRDGLGTGGRFLWIGDLARPDALLALLVALLTALASALAPNLPAQGRYLLVLLPALVALVFVWQASSGVALYWAVSTAAGAAPAVVSRLQRTRA